VVEDGGKVVVFGAAETEGNGRGKFTGTGREHIKD